VLGAAREHTVRLACTSGHEVVDEHTDVRFAALRQPGLAAFALEGRIDAGHQALRGCFFIARRAVDLAGEEQTRRDSWSPGMASDPADQRSRTRWRSRAS